MTSLSGNKQEKLFDEKSFYSSFLSDLEDYEQEVIIESPFISKSWMKMLPPCFRRLVNRNVTIYVVTKDPSILDEPLSSYSREIIKEFEILGVHVLATANHHHRKLSILDKQFLWERILKVSNVCDQDNGIDKCVFL